MNDFTKNELEYIAEAIEMWFKDYDSDTPERIYFKVKSMIDNYCEHQNIVTGSYPRSNPPKKCETCGEFYR